MKNLNTVALYDLMAEDLDVWVKKSNGLGFDVEIDDENGDALIRENNIHPAAIDSFADFCRSFLASYDNAQKKEAA